MEMQLGQPNRLTFTYNATLQNAPKYHQEYVVYHAFSDNYPFPLPNNKLLQHLLLLFFTRMPSKCNTTINYFTESNIVVVLIMIDNSSKTTGVYSVMKFGCRSCGEVFLEHYNNVAFSKIV